MAGVKFRVVSPDSSRSTNIKLYDQGQHQQSSRTERANIWETDHFRREPGVTGHYFYYVADKNQKKKTMIYWKPYCVDYIGGFSELPDLNGDAVPEVIIKLGHIPLFSSNESAPSFIRLESIPPKRK